jgi:hypothetical protein
VQISDIDAVPFGATFSLFVSRVPLIFVRARTVFCGDRYVLHVEKHCKYKILTC